MYNAQSTGYTRGAINVGQKRLTTSSGKLGFGLSIGTIHKQRILIRVFYTQTMSTILIFFPHLNTI